VIEKVTNIKTDVIVTGDDEGTAVVDGEERGTLITDEAGKYGGSNITDTKLEVPGSSDDGEVTFLVNGVEADTDPESVDWESGDVEEVDLKVDDIGESLVDVEIDEDASNLSIESNESATVIAELENTGDVDGVSDATFELDNETIVTEDERVFESGENEILEYAIELAEEDEYEAVVSTVDASDAVTIEVAEEDEEDDDPPPAGTLPDPPDDEPANISVTEANLSAITIDEDKSVDVIATFQNTGEEAGKTVAELAVDGEVVDSQNVSIGTTTSETVTFTETFTEPGEYNVSVNGLEAGELTIVEDEPEPANITIVDATVDTPEIEAGEEVVVDAHLENTGEAAGTHTATLTVNGEVLAQEAVEIKEEATTSISLSAPIDDPGAHEVFVDDLEADTVTVTEADDDVPDGDMPDDDVPEDDVPEDDTEDVDDDDGIPGFGGLVALAGLLGASIALMRRW